jgi:hypothetical protein
MNTNITYTTVDMGGGCEALRGELADGRIILATNTSHGTPKIDDTETLIDMTEIERYTGPADLDAAVGRLLSRA